jgi:hypothetical protein
MFYPSYYGSGMDAFTSTTATEARISADQAKTQTEILKHDIDRLLLITEALWTILKQQNNYTDDTLVQLIQGIEQSRTSPDSTTSKDAPIACPACGRPNTAKRNFCIYCGKPLPANPFAR